MLSRPRWGASSPGARAADRARTRPAHVPPHPAANAPRTGGGRGDYEIVYDSPMSRMARAEELVGVQRTMELLAPFAQINPEVLDVFDPDALARLTAEVSGVPTRCCAVRTPWTNCASSVGRRAGCHGHPGRATDRRGHEGRGAG